MNFDGGVWDDKACAEYVIQDFDDRFLMVGSSCLFKSSIIEVELRATWMSIIYARWELQLERVFINGDSATIIFWIQYEMKSVRPTYSFMTFGTHFMVLLPCLFTIFFER